MKRLLVITGLILTIGFNTHGQSTIIKDFKPVTDSLSTLIKEHNTVNGRLGLQAVMKRGANLDFYFTESLSDYPWYDGDVQWFRGQLKSLFPDEYSKYKLGDIYSKRIAYSNLVTPSLKSDGLPSNTRQRTKNPSRRNIVTPLEGLDFSKGLDGRHIAVWQSHGYYYAEGPERWQWQRPTLFQTVEDMYTQSYVLPYLVPMLENAGAYVLMPRERDVQRNEVIADNDETDARYGIAAYTEKGKWTTAGTGFAALKPTYVGLENPFTDGTARQINCAQQGKGNASAEWRPDIPERGEYAVYVSYKTVTNSTSSAHYTVHHLGGSDDFVVNQKMGGGTWIYLGTFEFAKGSDGYVTLTNETPEGYKFASGSVVTADAVRFGGGMGNIARAPKDDEDAVPEVSGMPRSAEGARYSLQWAGVTDKMFSQNEEKDDYKDDYMSRGDWVEWISRGSAMNSKKKGGLGIPVDLSFGFHTDAGITPDDAIIGTLAIYTLRSDGSQKLPDGESRMTSREFADMVQSQIVNDLRAEYDTLWNRRQIWDRSYRESRTPSAPAMLLELLSHQNFADMKYGLDPAFRFTASRAVYKGMLKYLSNRYGVQYAVQPLPVESMGVRFVDEDRAVVSWSPVIDRLEPTAVPTGYILYTRVDDGGFDGGRIIEDAECLSVEVDITPGHIYSYRVVAFNEGGKSFPSETVSIGMPFEGPAVSKAVLAVNNFDRISGPAFIDTPTYAGFDNRLDSGVPHIRDISFIGEMYDFRRQSEYVSNDNPGFGASYTHYAGHTVAGNTFDYPYVHGKAIMEAGYPFFSCSNERFCSDSTYRKAAWSVDLICGKQVTTVVGSGLQKRFEVFPTEMQAALTAFAADGGNILVSGAYIGTDIWNQIYPYEKNKEAVDAAKKFAQNTLGFKWGSISGSRKGVARYLRNDMIEELPSSVLEICNEINSVQYSVESPDGILPSGKSAASFMRYADSEISAGICKEGEGYRTVCLGFPIESLKSEEKINEIITLSLEFFSK